MPFDNTNRGAIWKNRDKKEEKHPDFKGSLNVNGVDYWVSAWKRKEGDAANKPALSFSIQPKDEQAKPEGKPKPSPSRNEDMDDQIPF
jgi:hypothetical protein